MKIKKWWAVVAGAVVGTAAVGTGAYVAKHRRTRKKAKELRAAEAARADAGTGAAESAWAPAGDLREDAPRERLSSAPVHSRRPSFPWREGDRGTVVAAVGAAAVR